MSFAAHVPEPDAPPRRHGARERRHVDLGRRRPDEGRAARRDLESRRPRRGRTVASLTTGREYHSTALLLPDGRVLMAGGGQLPGRATNIYSGEIYSPPYLFKGARPTIASAPSLVNYGSSFTVVDAGRGEHPEGRADPHAVGHARVRREPALHPAQLHRGIGPADCPGARRTATPRRRATTCSSSSTATACRPVASFVRLPGPVRGHAGADGARQPHRDGGSDGTVSLSLDGLDRQRRRRPLRRLPVDRLRLHAVAREPDRTADRHELPGHRARRRAPTTTSSRPRTRPGTSARVEPGERDDRLERHDAADRRRSPRPTGGARSRRRSRSTATASDNVGVAGVQFNLDGADPRQRGHDGAVLGHVGHDDGQRTARTR